MLVQADWKNYLCGSLWSNPADWRRLSFSTGFCSLSAAYLQQKMMFHAVSVSQVDFRDDAEELEADDDGAPKRAVHGRKVTAFVKAKAVGVGSPLGHVWMMWMMRLPGDSLELNVRYPILFCMTLVELESGV